MKRPWQKPIRRTLYQTYFTDKALHCQGQFCFYGMKFPESQIFVAILRQIVYNEGTPSGGRIHEPTGDEGAAQGGQVYRINAKCSDVADTQPMAYKGIHRLGV